MLKSLATEGLASAYDLALHGRPSLARSFRPLRKGIACVPTLSSHVCAGRLGVTNKGGSCISRRYKSRHSKSARCSKGYARFMCKGGSSKLGILIKSVQKLDVTFFRRGHALQLA